MYLFYFIISLATRNVSLQTVLPSFSAVFNKAEDWSLAHKWGLTGNLPDDHPYKSSAPSN